MKYLLISISVLWLGVTWCMAHSLSKIELKKPSDLVYQVHEDKDGHTLTISNPNPGKPSLREIIYYHIIEKPYKGGSNEDNNDEDSDSNETPFTNGQELENPQAEMGNPEETTDDNINVDVDQRDGQNKVDDKPEDITDDDIKVDVNKSDEQNKEDVKNNVSVRRRKREVLVKNSKPRRRSKRHSRVARQVQNAKKLAEAILENLKNSTQNDDKTVTEVKPKKDYAGIDADVNVQIGANNNEDDTYGMDLKGNAGTVWNNIIHTAYQVGDDSYSDEASEESEPASTSDSNESNISITSEITDSNESGSVGSESNESINALASGESSNSVDSNQNSSLQSTEDSPEDSISSPEFNGEGFISGEDSGYYSNEGSGYNSGDNVSGNGSDEGSNGSDYGYAEPDYNGSGYDPWSALNGNEGDNYGSGDYGSTENYGGQDGGDGIDIYFNNGGGSTNKPNKDPDQNNDKSDINKKFEQILDDLHDIFVKGNATVVFPPNTNDKDKNMNLLDMIHNIFSNIKNNKNILTPGVVVSSEGDPKKPNILNVLEGMFTNIIKNNIIINNNVPLKTPTDEVVGKKEEITPIPDPNVNNVPTSTEKNSASDTSFTEDITEATTNPSVANSDNPEDNVPTEVLPIEKKDPADISTSSPNETNNMNSDEGINNPKESGEHKQSYEPEIFDKHGNDDNPVESYSEEPKDTTDTPTDNPKEINCPVDAKKDENKPPEGENTKLDYMLDLMNNEKFWSFMGNLGAKYLESLTERTTKFIKDEVAAQVHKYFDEHKFDVLDNPSNNCNNGKIPEESGHNGDGKDGNEEKHLPSENNNSGQQEDRKPDNREPFGQTETPTTNIETTNLPYQTTEDSLKKDSDENNRRGSNRNPINVKADTVYGNTVGNDKVTNIFIFYETKNINDIVKNIKPLLNGKNSTNIFTFGPHKPKHGHQNNQNLPEVTTEETSSGIGITTESNLQENDLNTPSGEPFSEITTETNNKVTPSIVEPFTNDGNHGLNAESTTKSNSQEIEVPSSEGPVLGDNVTPDDILNFKPTTESNSQSITNSNSEENEIPSTEGPVLGDNVTPDDILNFKSTTESNSHSTTNSNSEENEIPSTEGPVLGDNVTPDDILNFKPTTESNSHSTTNSNSEENEIPLTEGPVLGDNVTPDDILNFKPTTESNSHSTTNSNSEENEIPSTEGPVLGDNVTPDDILNFKSTTEPNTHNEMTNSPNDQPSTNSYHPPDDIMNSIFDSTTEPNSQENDVTHPTDEGHISNESNEPLSDKSVTTESTSESNSEVTSSNAEEPITNPESDNNLETTTAYIVEEPVTNGDDHSSESNRESDNNSSVTAGPVTTDHDKSPSDSIETSTMSSLGSSEIDSNENPTITTNADVNVTPEKVEVTTVNHEIVSENDMTSTEPSTEASTVTGGSDIVTSNDEGETVSSIVTDANEVVTTEASNDVSTVTEGETSNDISTVTEADTNINVISTTEALTEASIGTGASGENKPETTTVINGHTDEITGETSSSDAEVTTESHIDITSEKSTDSAENVTEANDAGSGEKSKENSSETKPSTEDKVNGSDEKDGSVTTKPENSSESESPDVKPSSIEKKDSPVSSSEVKVTSGENSSKNKGEMLDDNKGPLIEPTTETNASEKASGETEATTEKIDSLESNSKSAEITGNNSTENSTEKANSTESMENKNSESEENAAEPVTSEPKTSSAENSKEKSSSTEDLKKKPDESKEKVSTENVNSNKSKQNNSSEKIDATTVKTDDAEVSNNSAEQGATENVTENSDILEATTNAASQES